MNIIETIRNLSLGIILAILIPMTIYWGVNIFMPYPSWDREIGEKIRNDERALKRVYDVLPFEEEPKDASKKEEYRKRLLEISDKERELEGIYRPRLKTFEAYYSLVSIIIGLITLIIGGFVTIPFIQMGLILGGAISIINGYISYAHRLDVIVNFILLLVALLIILFLSFRIARRERSF